MKYYSLGRRCSNHAWHPPMNQRCKRGSIMASSLDLCRSNFLRSISQHETNDFCSFFLIKNTHTGGFMKN